MPVACEAFSNRRLPQVRPRLGARGRRAAMHSTPLLPPTAIDRLLPPTAIDRQGLPELVATPAPASQRPAGRGKRPARSVSVLRYPSAPACPSAITQQSSPLSARAALARARPSCSRPPFAGWEISRNSLLGGAGERIEDRGVVGTSLVVLTVPAAPGVGRSRTAGISSGAGAELFGELAHGHGRNADDRHPLLERR
jgi:hypothetical protein